MLIMKYNGGLGNQMFQFAAIASLAKKLNVDFSFDMSFFKHKYARPYEMGVFNVEKKESKDIRTKLFWSIRRYLKTNNFLGINIYRESSFNFEEKFSEIKDNTFIEGYFQSFKYIDDEIVEKYFNFKNEPDALNMQIVDTMQKEDSISLHIRRGDYVNKKRYQNVYNHLSVKYYQTAMEIIAKSTSSPVFYVFSDDIEWAKANLTIENLEECKQKNARLVFICHNTGKNSYMDLRLMANCKHNIIANSSFSYWGAYLNKNDRKIVIAPEKWFNDPNKTTDDLYPKSWSRLDIKD